MKRGRESGDIETMAMANCLMLLSKDGQMDASDSEHNNIHRHQHQHRVFACKTCDKRFSSFQALGGHRASHKKTRLADEPKKPKTHECSICGLEFPIGQALGGHMRRHRAASNDGLVNPHDFSSEMKRSSGTADGGLCLDLKLAPCGIDWDYKVEKVPRPVVHLFI